MTGGGKALVPINTPIGRPRGTSVYGQDVEDEIIERMEDGQTLTSICRNDQYGRPRERGTFPTHARVYDWADITDTGYRPSFALRFARAKIAQHRTWVEETVDIANTPQIGVEEVREHSAKNGVSLKRAYKDMLHHRMLQINTRLEAAARMDPQRWAVKLQQAEKALADNTGEPDRVIIEGGLPDDDVAPQ